VNITNSPILLVDDEEQILLSYEAMLISEGINNVISVSDSSQVMSLLNEQEVATIVLDLNMPHLSGSVLMGKIKEQFPDISIIVVTAINELENAVECMKMGAVDYIVKPVEQSRFIASVTQALKITNLSEEVTSLKNHVLSLKKHLITDHLQYEQAFSEYLTCSKKMRGIFHYIEAISKLDKPVLIYGETGVGKEILSRVIHEISGLTGKFIGLNIAGLDDNMFSDALFGHRKGAFTGADSDRDGFLVQASGGTLLLDEIGDLNHTSQIKLLRLIEEGIYYPLGSDKPEKSNARIVASTNRNLLKRISDGTFRKDLYYRLVAAQVSVPPLRERLEDIPILLDYFLSCSAEDMGKKKPTVPIELLTLLSNYNYPGNVRELKAMVFDAVARHKSGVLSLKYFKDFIQSNSDHISVAFMENDKNSDLLIDLSRNFPAIRDVIDYMIKEALKRSNGNQGIAATMLGITRQALNKRINKASRTKNTD